MYDLLKLAALSAALAAALVTMLDGRNAAPNAARVLSGGAPAQVAPAPAKAKQSGPLSSCTSGWPYQDNCAVSAGRSQRSVRVITPDNIAGAAAMPARTHFAQQ